MANNIRVTLNVLKKADLDGVHAWFISDHNLQISGGEHKWFNFIYSINKAGYKEICGLECAVCYVSSMTYSDAITIYNRSIGNNRRFKFKCDCGHTPPMSNKPSVLTSRILSHLKKCKHQIITPVQVY